MKNKIITFCIICLLFTISTPAEALNTNSSSNYLIYIDLNCLTLYLLDKNTEDIVKSYPVAIGKKNTPSPIGTWQIKSKALMKGPFGGYWLGLNAPWDTFGIHGTSNPSSIGSMASNGCIRLYNYNIKELFNLVDYGTSVIISGGCNWRFSPYERIAKPNDKGADIYHVQRILNGLGYYEKEADGIYDYPLQLAILKYKKDFNLKENTEINNEFLKSIGCPKFE